MKESDAVPRFSSAGFPQASSDFPQAADGRGLSAACRALSAAGFPQASRDFPQPADGRGLPAACRGLPSAGFPQSSREFPQPADRRRDFPGAMSVADDRDGGLPDFFLERPVDFIVFPCWDDSSYAASRFKTLKHSFFAAEHVS